ncbi:MAG: tRNA guanosine(34) transglycosylase Tgt [Planctomycetes bacterium]|nr:tRNA guanosine(34) transglycosylase Tgt [Planctomycetota bacterium]MCB9891837.1 tRNA guanosine(34) transglycosylase Tgt [Planctomycetota bacterium]MCB9918693.1 tRNA guanosine(34) transglycosylase Tgt [Planctomycetota bacterium]
MNEPFQLIRSSTIDAPRRGRFTTPHGSFETPCFAPCATVGALKGLLPEQARSAGVELVLGNTYHLALRPGAELIAAAGGLHRFMGWDGPILTDSGGYQVFSLAGKRRVSDDGVVFAGTDAGAALELTPREALRIQSLLGSDIAMVLDECPPAGATGPELADACRRTVLWAERARARHDERGGLAASGQALFGIVQGGWDVTKRSEVADALVEMDFDGYAVGGVSVGETKEQMDIAIEASTPRLPEAKIRYLMGVGEPDDLFEGVMRGIDMFDCVTPTRHGRNNRVYVRSGFFNMRNATFREDFRPIDETCGCPCCSRYTRAYVRHLALAREMNAAILQSLHNLWFLENLVQGLGTRIEAGDDECALRAWFASEYPGFAQRPRANGR